MVRRASSRVSNQENRSRRDLARPQDPLAIFEVGQERRRRSLVEYRAALQCEHAIGQRQHEVEIVLHDNNRGVAAQPVEHLEQLEDDRRRKAFERFVQQRRLYVPDIARATATICCSPPDG